MLSKFLFVGLGGSGGKTLQFLHQNLELRLKAIDKKMPKAWQFLWLDVPTTPDLLDPGSGVKPLPNRYYQSLAGGLEIRFAGSTDSTQAAANDEWEIEVFGRHEVVDVSSGKSVKMTRTGRASYKRKYN